MSLEGLLAFIGIVVAIYAIARPVQRASLALFVPRWLIPSSCFISLILIVIRDAPFGIKPLFGLSQEEAQYCLGLSAFGVPVIGLMLAVFLWSRAKLTKRNVAGLSRVLKAALLESEFDEAERILRENLGRAHLLPATAIDELFEPRVACEFMRARSFVHLELLADETLESLIPAQKRFASVSATVRALFCAELSPLHAVVVEEFGGDEDLRATDWQNEIIAKTILKPEWYFRLRADYPLLMVALEALQDGRLDRTYNQASSLYGARQGLSTRRDCSVYIAAKAHVLALDKAVQNNSEHDPYCTDLSDLFREVLSRSEHRRDSWESALAYLEFPTPYAYLMYEILSDLEKLARSSTGVESGGERFCRHEIAEQVAVAWSICVSFLAGSDGQVSDRFRDARIEQYLVFVLELHAASEWLEDRCAATYLEELRKRLQYASEQEQMVVQTVFGNLDRARASIGTGVEWLAKEMSWPER